MQQAKQTHLPTSFIHGYRPFTAKMFAQLMRSILSLPSSWPRIAYALNQTYLTGEADLLMDFYMKLTSYDPIRNIYTNYANDAAFEAMFCPDYLLPSTYQQEDSWVNQLAKINAKNPLGAIQATFFAKSCIDWPQDVTPLFSENPEPILNTPNILLIATAHDPLTPIHESEKLSEYLGALGIKPKLLIWQGAGHVAYHRNAPLLGCVDEQIDKFFLGENLPFTITCHDKINPFIPSLRVKMRQSWKPVEPCC